MGLLILYIIIGAIIFRQLPLTFFQQDEWAIFGNFLYWEKANLNIFQRLFIYEQATHLIPLSNFFSYLQFKAFGLNFFPYGVISILLHSLNAFVVSLLAKKLTGNRMVSFFAGVLFLVNSIPHQAITWVATTIGTAGATLGTILALLFFVKHLERTKSISSSLFLSFGFFLVALLFKETSIFVFVLYPFVWAVLCKKRTWRELSVLMGILVCFGVLYGASRLFITGFWKETAATQQDLAQPSFLVYAFRFFTHPIKILAQSILPVPIILRVARSIVRFGYPQFTDSGTPDPYLVESVAADIVSMVASITLGFLGVVSFLRLKQKKETKLTTTMFLSLGFIAATSIPLVVIPGKAGYISLFDGRHLYIASVFVSIGLSTVLYGVYQTFRSHIIKIGIGAFIAIYVGLHAMKIDRDLAYQVAIGSLRTSILSTVHSLYPTLPSKAVFFIESDKAYYGLPPEETIVPFQSGFGQTLLVWYNTQGEEFPACFFEKKYLYVLLEQNYKECDGRGFGYFRNVEKLQSSTEVFRIQPEEVIAFRFYSSTNVFTDQSPEIRERLK